MSNVMPLAKPHLERTPLGDELIVFDPQTELTICLNQTAATILSHCDGKTKKQLVAERLGEAQFRDDLLELTLSELARKQLLATNMEPTLTRRDFLARWGATAALIPLVASIQTPAAAQAVSPGGGGVDGGPDGPPDSGGDGPPDGAPDIPDLPRG